MRVFKGFNKNLKDVCPVCNTDTEKETVLCMIDGTLDGGLARGIQVHLDCITLTFKPETGNGRAILYQVIPTLDERKSTNRNNKRRSSV